MDGIHCRALSAYNAWLYHIHVATECVTMSTCTHVQYSRPIYIVSAAEMHTKRFVCKMSPAVVCSTTLSAHSTGGLGKYRPTVRRRLFSSTNMSLILR